MKKSLNILAITAFTFLSISINTFAQSIKATPKPLWKSGTFGGGTPSNANPKETSVLFQILNDKKTVKGFGAFFPITCYYDDGTVATKTENISRSTSPTFTLSLNDSNQRKSFKYTDDFGIEWDVLASFKWDRASQSFKVHLGVTIPKEQLEDNYCKTDVRLANKAVRLKSL